jgi:predicted enzyme related to lactoylglutathione lyase
LLNPKPAADPVPSESEFAGPQRIGQIAVPVADLERAIAFYAEVLGLRFLFRAPPGLAFFDCGGVRLMLTREEGSDLSARGGIIYYVVPDLAAAHAALGRRGVAFLDAPQRIARLADHELWMAFCRDSEGNLLGLMSEVPLP